MHITHFYIFYFIWSQTTLKKHFNPFYIYLYWISFLFVYNKVMCELFLSCNCQNLIKQNVLWTSIILASLGLRVAGKHLRMSYLTSLLGELMVHFLFHVNLFTGTSRVNLMWSNAELRNFSGISILEIVLSFFESSVMFG